MLARLLFIWMFLISSSAFASGEVMYIHTDGLGSPVARTDKNGNLISRTRYEPYGATAAGATPTIGFTGHVNDPDTGLIYMQQRYYDPYAGRFLSTDPVLTNAATGGGFNRYTYANLNPYKFIDPDGRIATSDSEKPWDTEQINGITRPRDPCHGQPCLDNSSSQGSTSTDSSSNWFDISNWSEALGRLTSPFAASYGQAGQDDGRALKTTSAMMRDIAVIAALPAVGMAAGPQAASSVSSVPSVVRVTSWASRGITPDLNAGRWVMPGNATRWNFTMTGLWGPQWSVQRGLFFGDVPFANSITGTVPASSVIWPTGANWIRGVFGQRILSGF